MPLEQSSKSQSLSEISHLFLSGVREKHNNGSPRPVRIGPGQFQPTKPPEPASKAPAPIPSPAAILQPQFSPADEEPDTESVSFDQRSPLDTDPAPRTPPISALLSVHLNERQFEYIKDYARHLASIHGRIGLIEVGLTEFRLMSFEAGHSLLDPDLEEIESSQCQSSAELSDALQEMNWDVDRWLVAMPNPRTAEARSMFAGIDHWVLLSTCDHDGVVASYRTLKSQGESYRPRLSLALMDGADENQTRRVYEKLSGVCQQFLNWELEDESVVHKCSRVAEHLVLYYRSDAQSAAGSAAPEWWKTVGDFLKNLKAASPEQAAAQLQAEQEIETDMIEETTQAVPAPAPINGPRIAQSEPVRQEAHVAAPAFARMSYPPAEAAPTFRTFAATRDTAVEVLDVDADGGPESILTAILQQNQGEIIECPIRAPMCAAARLGVTRDRGVIMLAVAGEGLSDLRSIGLAYRWIAENRSLIGMALPQFAIDPARPPRLRLLVEHGDVSAGVLQPILQSEHITVQAYRKLRWGGKTGLFLEAA
ncbi:MAG TPA: hypothetical protein VG326_16510 [Tepidisphaeraceae bacterium]|jgi:hypothetical protein|nr:hypothetical protein [Tepidisphaeraceae bacterium]